MTTRRTVLLLSVAACLPAAAKDYFVYVGTYTGPKSKGIYAFRFDTDSGKLAPVGLVGETPNPSFGAIHPNQRYLYSVNEEKTGTVSAFSIDAATGKLTPLNQVSSKGGGPCHLNLDKTGQTLVVANYNTGSVASYPVGKDGRLGEAASFIQHAGSSADPRRQQGPHAHSVNISADNRFVIAADLGLDQVKVYKIDPVKATLAENNPPFAKVNPGGGPRHFAFNPDGKHAYVINEMQSTVTAFDWDKAAGTLKEIQTLSTLPKDYTGTGNSTAEVVAHPSGKFLYGSNRGHNSIAVFSVDRNKGTLTLVENASTQGSTPRNFAIDPSGKWLLAANQRSDNIVVFKIDQATGRLTPTGQSVEAGSPVCIRFVPAR
jgi:6-phosphogluconolactonase